MYAFHAYHAVQNGSKPYKSLNLLITLLFTDWSTNWPCTRSRQNTTDSS